MDDRTNTPPLLHKMASGLVRGGAMAAEVFLHRRFGIRYLINFGAVGVLMMSAYVAFLPKAHVEPILIFALAFGVAWILMILESWLRFWRGDSEHSMCRGVPRLLHRDSARKEYWAKQLGEPIVVACLGYIAFQGDGPLGVYWMFSAACLFISSAEERRWETRDAMMLHDAALLQQKRAKRFREIHGVRDFN